ncbi:MAG: DNA recombination protein RmuC [Bacteroidaceae bacterium]|nr:DNA recombination protein RmuC [Bacteroidaceae bacterium]
MEYVFALVGLLVGFVVGYLIVRSQVTALQAKLDMTTADNIQLTEEKERQIQTYTAQIAGLQTEHNRQEEQLRAEATKQQDGLRSEYNRQLETLRADYTKQLLDQREQQRQQLEQQLHLLREQMTTASERILKERSEELSQNNAQQLSAILNPLRTEITQMKETVDKSGREHTTSMERLDASIKANMEKANLLSERADRLANALIGDNNKQQGDFGELRLKQLLEDMGLEEGVQFEEQSTMKDEFGRTIYEEEEGHRLIPDVILHFPDNRDVIIDSKMSFTAYVDYQNAKTDEERDRALERHISSVRSHVHELAKKNYSKYIKADHSRLDFVLMYVFQESALQLALANAPTLWKEAYDKGVVISGSQNLYMMLRVLQLTWRQVRQVENQQKIMEAANAIIDRVQLFYERFLKVEEQFDKTRKAFDDVKTVTAPTGPSITTAANKLLKFGAKENPKRKQRLPKEDTTESPVSELPQNDQSAASLSEY